MGELIEVATVSDLPPGSCRQVEIGGTSDHPSDHRGRHACVSGVRVVRPHCLVSNEPGGDAQVLRQAAPQERARGSRCPLSAVRVALKHRNRLRHQLAQAKAAAQRRGRKR